MLKLYIGFFTSCFRLQFWQALMGPIIQAATNRSEFQLDRLLGQDENWETPWGKGPYIDHLTQGVQWRVKDAKAAGIHPVAALGFSPGQPHFAFQQRGSRVPGVSAPRMGSPNTRSPAGMAAVAAQAAAQGSRSRLDEAMAGYYDAQAARIRQSSNVGGDPLTTMGGKQHQPGPGSPAEDWEREYGEISDWFEGAPRYIRDKRRNRQRELMRKGYAYDEYGQLRRYGGKAYPYKQKGSGYWSRKYYGRR